MGASKGAYTYWLSKYSRHVHAYEPNPKMFEVLKAGVGGAKTVTLSNVALSNKTGKAQPMIPRTKNGLSNQGASLEKAKIKEDFITVDVETKRLDDEGLTDVGLIKIDVEGFEPAVLEGARETILRDKPVLLIEIEEHHNGIPIEESLNSVMALGYDGFAFIDGVLKSLDFFDAEVSHRHNKDKEGYIFNFLFLPRKK